MSGAPLPGRLLRRPGCGKDPLHAQTTSSSPRRNCIDYNGNSCIKCYGPGGGLAGKTRGAQAGYSSSSPGFLTTTFFLTTLRTGFLGASALTGPEGGGAGAGGTINGLDGAGGAAAGGGAGFAMVGAAGAAGAGLGAPGGAGVGMAAGLGAVAGAGGGAPMTGLETVTTFGGSGAGLAPFSDSSAVLHSGQAAIPGVTFAPQAGHLSAAWAALAAAGAGGGAGMDGARALPQDGHTFQWGFTVARHLGHVGPRMAGAAGLGTAGGAGAGTGAAGAGDVAGAIAGFGGAGGAGAGGGLAAGGGAFAGAAGGAGGGAAA